MLSAWGALEAYDHWRSSQPVTPMELARPSNGCVANGVRDVGRQDAGMLTYGAFRDLEERCEEIEKHARELAEKEGIRRQREALVEDWR